jgi:nitrogen regulatory protein PII
MKEIKAYLKKQKLHQVIEALHEIEGLTGVSIMDIIGYGRSREADLPVHIVDDISSDVAHVKLEIICSDKIAKQVVNSIQEAAHTGLRSDGKIYISEREEAVRISTNERGPEAV